MSWIDDVLPVACLRSRTGNPDPEKVIDPEALSNTVRPSLDEMTHGLRMIWNLPQRMLPK